MNPASLKIGDTVTIGYYTKPDIYTGKRHPVTTLTKVTKVNKTSLKLETGHTMMMNGKVKGDEGLVLMPTRKK